MRRHLTSLRNWGSWTGDLAFLHKYRPPTPSEFLPHPLQEGINGVEIMAQVAPRDIDKALVALCGFCGLRVGEAIAATVLWVVRDASDDLRLRVRGKGDKERVVPISYRAWKYLQPAHAQALVNVTDPAGRLCPLPDRTARQRLTRLGIVALGRPIASHDLRATFATAAYNQSKDIRAVQKLLGHASIETTQGYVAASMAAMKQAVNF